MKRNNHSKKQHRGSSEGKGRLTLRKEVLRELIPQSLDQVMGGYGVNCIPSCGQDSKKGP